MYRFIEWSDSEFGEGSVVGPDGVIASGVFEEDAEELI
jgi:hypothetical protein